MPLVVGTIEVISNSPAWAAKPAWTISRAKAKPVDFCPNLLCVFIVCLFPKLRLASPVPAADACLLSFKCGISRQEQSREGEVDECVRQRQHRGMRLVSSVNRQSEPF